MHMADALVSPAVGTTLWAAAAGLVAWSARALRKMQDEQQTALMGVLGAFIFAAQMINFSIPGTGSSGHLCGGLMAAILLGPHAAFLVIVSVLAVQALFFMDGGLLAMGANIINMGFFSAFVAYPLVFRPIAGKKPKGARIWLASLVASVVGLQLGAFGVVVETRLSGLADLPFSAFLLAMQPIHFAIGIVEGLITAAVVTSAALARPGILSPAPSQPAAGKGIKNLLVGLGLAAIIIGGALSWFASTHPDGLEWALERVSGKEEMEAPDTGLHAKLAAIQEKTSFLPDYGFPSAGQEEEEQDKQEQPEPWPSVSMGTTVSGFVGGLLTLLLAGLLGLLLKARSAKSASA